MLNTGNTPEGKHTKSKINIEMVGNAKYTTLTEQSSVKLSKICPEGGSSLKPMKVKQIS